MKTKKIKKKLKLDKSTISNLYTGRMKEVKGGIPVSDPPVCPTGTENTCITCYGYTCPQCGGGGGTAKCEIDQTE